MVVVSNSDGGGGSDRGDHYCGSNVYNCTDEGGKLLATDCNGGVGGGFQ